MLLARLLPLFFLAAARGAEPQQIAGGAPAFAGASLAENRPAVTVGHRPVYPE